MPLPLPFVPMISKHARLSSIPDYRSAVGARTWAGSRPKTLLWAAEHTARHHDIPGIQVEVKRFDFSEVMAHELRLVERLREEKYSKVLEHLKHVTVLDGKAEFVADKTIEVNGTRITGEHFIIAVGSTGLSVGLTWPARIRIHRFCGARVLCSLKGPRLRSGRLRKR